jgi:hypothetical protein
LIDENRLAIWKQHLGDHGHLDISETSPHPEEYLELLRLARLGLSLDKALDIWPVTIVNDRYGGAYSGAEWLAFHRGADAVPDAIGGGDCDEQDFWGDDPAITAKEHRIGRGRTPHEAMLDLKAMGVG